MRKKIISTIPDSLNAKTILLVEDENPIAQTKCKVLEKAGFSVMRLRGGQEAVEAARALGSRLGLALMDTNLGSGMDGIEAAKLIQLERNIPIVFMSSKVARETGERIKTVDCHGFIPKNSSAPVILATIEIALRLFETKHSAPPLGLKHKETVSAKNDDKQDPYAVYLADMVHSAREFPEKIVESFINQGALVDALFDTTKHLVLLIDSFGSIRKASKFVQTILGRHPDSCIGLNWIELFVSSDERERANTIVHSTYTNSRHDSRLSFMTANRTRLGVEIYARSLRSGGTPYGLLLTGTLSFVPEAQGRANDFSSETTSRILHNIKDAVLVVEPDTQTISECNLSASSVFGYSREEMLEAPARLIHPDSGSFAVYRERVMESFQQTGFLETELELIRKNGTRFPALVLNLPIFDARGELSRTALIIKDQTQDQRFQGEKRLIITRLKELADAISGLSEQFGDEGPVKRLTDFGATPRQMEIARCVLNGLLNKEIARALNLSESSVKVHVYTLYKRVGVRSRVEFVQFMRDNGVRLD